MTARIVGHSEAVADPDLSQPERLGGKATKLAELGRAGLPVPPWLCVTTAVHADVANGDLPADDRRLLLERFDATFAADAWVAVRSSAASEDSAQDSFAGQLDTYLYVTRDQVPARVVECFGSASSPSALLYRQVRGLGDAPVRAAAVVQQMVESRVAGILFTANPTSGARDEAVVTAGLGLGEGVVGDQVETDTWFLELATGAIRRRAVSAKRSRIVLDREHGTGTRKEQVDPTEGDPPALSDEQLQELCALGRKVQDHFGGDPQDIEWAIDGSGQIHLLQARPITTLDRETIFDNSNVVESYPGLSSPLTYSFARFGYEQTFRAGSRTFGVPEEILQEKHHVHANLLGLIDGRIYYNILNWYGLFLLVPGFEGVLPAWERALGLPPRFVQRPPAQRSRPLLKLRILWRTLGHFFRLRRSVGEFQAMFAAEHAAFKRRDLAELEAHELLELYERLGRKILGPYAISLVNDFFAQQLYDQVGKLIARWEIGDPDALRNNLLCGESGMDSVEPVRSILGLVDRVRADRALRKLVESDRPGEEVWAELHAGPNNTFKEALARHLDRYGDRTLHELKLETPSVGENPGFLITMLRNYLRGGQDLAAMEERERKIRFQAEWDVGKGLAWHPFRRLIFRWALKHCRRTVKYRENLRLTRSRAYGMIKRIFRALGHLLAERGLLAAPEDVFWLTVEEVAAHVRGHAVTRDLRALVAIRQEEWKRYEDTSPGPRVVTQGVVYATPFLSARDEAHEEGNELRGTGCSPGKVRARAKVIENPAQDMTINGEILVSPMTDPGWVFLMVAAGGLVVEKGSMLSHTAIIGRELGIPTVVGVKDATRRIQDGQLIEIDGQAGTVTIVEE